MATEDRLRLHQAQPLPEYMSRLAANLATGRLLAHANEGSREVFFVDGEIRSATSSIEGEKIGLWLVERNIISDNERALTLLSQSGEDGQPLGQLLLSRGLVDESTLEGELEELTLTIIRRAASAPRAYCEFKEDPEVDPYDTLPTMTTTQLILVAAREYPDIEAKRTTLGPLDQTARPVNELDALLEDLNLTPSEAFLLSRLDGNRSLSTVITISALTQDEAVATLYGLKLAGVLSIGAETDHVRAASPYSSTHAQAAQELPEVVDESVLSASHREERNSVRRMSDKVTTVDHYGALRLQPGAKPNEIKDAWLVLQEHFDPKRVANPHLRDMERQLTAITERAREAFEVLSDPASRRRYDRILRTIDEEQKKLQRGAAQRSQTDAGVRSELVEANLKRAAELTNDGEIYLAIQLLEQACAFEPRPKELVKLAKLLLRNPLWSNRALNYLRRAVDVDPYHIDAWIELAEFWRRRNNVERQRKALERALTIDPDSVRAQQMYSQLVGRRELARWRRRRNDIGS